MNQAVIFCSGCQKQRWAPRVPEAMHGWKRLPGGAWQCPECLANLKTVKEGITCFLWFEDGRWRWSVLSILRGDRYGDEAEQAQAEAEMLAAFQETLAKEPAVRLLAAGG